jgi:metallophosphoesterase superfamily enzyme
MLDAVVLSDIHLGSDNCQARRVCELLERIADGELATARLILNGDVFDSIDFHRLHKTHWKVLSLRNRAKITYRTL